VSVVTEDQRVESIYIYIRHIYNQIIHHHHNQRKMTGYNGRTGPNVSEYIANLNAIPSTQEGAGAHPEGFNLEEDLAMFTNTQFFDFDLGHDADLQPPSTSYDGHNARASTDGLEMKPIDFLNSDFSFPEFESFAQQHPPLYEGLSHGAPAGSRPPTSSLYGSATPVTSPTNGLNSNGSQKNAKAGEKRKSDADTPDFEEASRMAAEEDKRRRNTAASARFRIKKKQREQALERSAKEMSDKVAALEGRINQLETENKWLKSLITEKNESKEDIAALWKKYNQQSSDRIKAERKDGVGTSSASSKSSSISASS